jgi:hypothetical protein
MGPAHGRACRDSKRTGSSGGPHGTSYPAFSAQSGPLRRAAENLPGAQVAPPGQGVGFLPVTDQLASGNASAPKRRLAAEHRDGLMSAASPLVPAISASPPPTRAASPATFTGKPTRAWRMASPGRRRNGGRPRQAALPGQPMPRHQGDRRKSTSVPPAGGQDNHAPTAGASVPPVCSSPPRSRMDCPCPSRFMTGRSLLIFFQNSTAELSTCGPFFQ